MIRRLVAGFAALAVAGPAAAEDALITVRGIIPEPTNTVPGSISIVSAEALLRLQPITIKDALRRVPGVQLIDEDAFGQKLNISVRGLNARRSGRTLLLEDGAPIQPAPYADPSAHHSPPLERIEQIEVRRGSAQLLFGPQTIGGVINFVTRPVPDRLTLDAMLAAGERGYFGGHAGLGAGDADSGVRLDLIHKRGDGIRDGHDTQLGEVAIKGRIGIAADHGLTLKGSYQTERSHLTEGGLDAARFAANPYGNPFSNDVFRLDRTAVQAIHDWRIGKTMALSTQAYFADTFRASYRQADTSIDAMTANPATGCVGAARTDYENFASRCGNKMRPRRFRFWGVEPRLDGSFSLFGAQHAVIIGARGHFESTNRKRYNGLTPDAREDSPGTLLRDDNDITTSAFAAYGQDSIDLGTVTLTPGLRFEQIRTRNTANRANFVAIARTATVKQSLLLPGIGVAFAPTPALTAFAGAHRGFAPPRPDRDFNPDAPFNVVKPERSREIEIGVRSRPAPRTSIDATLFEMALDDVIVEAPLVGGRSGSFVNAGQARHRGLEVSAVRDVGRVRLSVAWTWLFEAKFLSDVGEGSVAVRGNRIPYAPENLVYTAIGYEHPGGGGGEIGVNHVGRQFANASNTVIATADGLNGSIPARTLARLALHYQPPGARWRLFATAENLFDKVWIASRVDGLFAGQRRQVVVGLRFTDRPAPPKPELE